MHLISDHKLAYSISTAAEATEVPQGQIRKAMDSGELRFFRVGNNRRISKLALEAWMFRLERLYHVPRETNGDEREATSAATLTAAGMQLPG